MLRRTYNKISICLPYYLSLKNDLRISLEHSVMRLEYTIANTHCQNKREDNNEKNPFCYDKILFTFLCITRIFEATTY